MVVKANIKKNRLFLKSSGSVSKKELDKIYTDIRFAVADLLPGFSVINDLSECTLCHISGIATYKKISNYLIQNGAKNVVRIINKESLVLKQFLQLAARFAEYIPVYVSTLEEAEALLDNSDERNSLSFHFAGQPSVKYFSNTATGEGHVLNISTSGCKIISTTLPPVIDQEVDITVSFNVYQTAQKTFNAKACVVRTDNNGFAVEYSNLSEGRKNELWQDLLLEFEYDAQAFPSDVGT